MLAINKFILKVVMRGNGRRQRKPDSFWKFRISLEEGLEEALTELVLRGMESGGNNL